MKVLNYIILACGIVFLFSGVFVSCHFWKDYEKVHKEGVHFQGAATQASSTINQSNIEDLGTVLGGTAGLLFSIASVLFFTFSLFQNREELALTRQEMALTRQEMSNAQELTQNQIAQSTYFNLLKHQKDLYSSSDDFPNSIAILQTNIREFVRLLNGRGFIAFAQTEYSPLITYVNLPPLQVLGLSLLNVANFIFDKMDNEEFFHRTFFLSLSEQEKFLIGAILENDLSNGMERQYNFDYRQTYRQTSPFINMHDSRFFPATHFSGFSFPVLYIAATPDPTDQREEIEEKTKFMVMPIPRQGLVLDRIYYTCHYMTQGMSGTKQDRGSIEPIPGLFEANLYSVFQKIWVDLPNVIERVAIEFNFSFTYKNDTYTIGWLKVGITPTPHPHTGDHVAELITKFPGTTIYQVIVSPLVET